MRLTRNVIRDIIKEEISKEIFINESDVQVGWSPELALDDVAYEDHMAKIHKALQKDATPGSQGAGNQAVLGFIQDLSDDLYEEGRRALEAAGDDPDAQKYALKIIGHSFDLESDPENWIDQVTRYVKDIYDLGPEQSEPAGIDTDEDYGSFGGDDF